MELYALIGIALIAVTLIHKKLSSGQAGQLTRRLSAPPSPVTIKPFNPVRVPNGIADPMEVDEDMLTCTPLQPPSPMSTSETSSSDFVIDPEYIK